MEADTGREVAECRKDCKDFGDCSTLVEELVSSLDDLPLCESGCLSVLSKRSDKGMSFGTACLTST